MIEAFNQHFPGSEEWLFLLLPCFLAAYLLPFFIATGRKHSYLTAIGLANVFLGWTVLGWLAAMIWSVNRDLRDPAKRTAPADGPLYYLNEPSLNEHPSRAEGHAHEYRDTRACPFCAETIKAQAILCRHCGRDIAGSAVARQGSMATPASIEQHFAELEALLKDREEAAAEKFREDDVLPAMNYVPEEREEEIQVPQAKEAVSQDVVRELSGWKKFG